MLSSEMPDPSPPAGQPSPSPNPGQLAALDPVARRAATRAAVLAGAAGSAGARPAAPGPATSPPAGQPAPAVPPPAGADPAPAQVAAPAPEPNDPAAVFRRQEQHLRRQLAQERQQQQADFDQQRQQWQRQLDEAGKLKALFDKRDILGMAAAAGYGEADYEALAQSLYAASPEGRKDPNRARAAQAQLERRQERTEVERLRAEFDEYKTSAAKREEQAQQQAQAQLVAARWLDSVHATSGDETPLARAAADKNVLNQRLLAETDRLWFESGPSDDLREMPTPAQVLRSYETRRRAELEALRPEYEALTKLAPASAAANPAPAGDPPPAGPQNPVNGDPSRRSRLVAGIHQARQGA